MGRLIVSANMTTDMVIDPLEGWFQPDLATADGLAQLSAADAVILGRKTYEKLADFWPKSDDEWADLINPMPKHVASRTLKEPLTWNAKLLGADLADDVAALKKRYSRRSASVRNRRAGELPCSSESRRRGEVLGTSLHLGRRREAVPCGRTPASTAPYLCDDICIRHREVGIPARG